MEKRDGPRVPVGKGNINENIEREGGTRRQLRQKLRG